MRSELDVRAVLDVAVSETGRALDAPRERVGLVRRLLARRAVRDVHEDAPALCLDGIGGDAVLLEAGLALAGAAMELPKALTWSSMTTRSASTT